MPPLGRFPDQVERRRDEADRDRQRGGGARRPGRCAVQAARLDRAHALGRAETLVAPPVAFEQHQRHHHDQHGAGDLRRTGQVGARDPGRVDRDGERLDAEEFRSADVIERLQQRQAQADGQRGPGERQRDAEEGAAAAFAQRAGRFHQVGRLGHEHGARGHVDIGVEHEAEHEDRARHRAQVGQAELARAVEAQRPADRALHRADRVQQIEVGEGDDVGRHGQRQQQGPVQHASPREVAGRDQPGAAGADHQHQHAHAGQQHCGVERGLRQHVLREMRPVREARAQREPDQAENRCEHAEGDEDRRGSPDRPYRPCTRHWSKPTLSTSALACLRYLAISVMGSGSTFNSPMLEAMIESSATPLRTGYS
jgi:hypothetical protein